jgi:hypothetical protein
MRPVAVKVSRQTGLTEGSSPVCLSRYRRRIVPKRRSSDRDAAKRREVALERLLRVACGSFGHRGCYTPVISSTPQCFSADSVFTRSALPPSMRLSDDDETLAFPDDRHADAGCHRLLLPLPSLAPMVSRNPWNLQAGQAPNKAEPWPGPTLMVFVWKGLRGLNTA